MSPIRKASLAAVVVALCGCYHATIETSLEPSPQVIDDPWADAWVLGLVPPETVETASECTNGVAKIETRLSFLNQLVGLLTIGIYTPMSIKVTCAAAENGGSASSSTPRIELEEGATTAQRQRAIGHAARLSARTGQPVWVRF